MCVRERKEGASPLPVSGFGHSLSYHLHNPTSIPNRTHKGIIYCTEFTYSVHAHVEGCGLSRGHTSLTCLSLHLQIHERGGEEEQGEGREEESSLVERGEGEGMRV